MSDRNIPATGHSIKFIDEKESFFFSG